MLLLLVTVLLAGTLIAYRATARIATDEQWVTHTYEVMGAIDGLISTLQRAQNTADDFIATGTSEHLAVYRATTLRIQPGIDQIQSLTADNPTQQQALVGVQKNALELRVLLDDAVESRLRGKPMRPTGELQRSIVQDLRGMKSREAELLTRRSGEATRSLRTTRVGLLAGAAINCVLLFLAALMLVRDEKQRGQIRESRGRLASIVDSSEDAIISKKLDGTITSWNQGAQRLYGYTSEEMIGRPIYDIVPADRHEELREILERLGRGERVEHLETVRIRRDGTPVEMELTISPVRDGTGKIVEASAIGRDITERKLLERSLHQLSVRILRAQDEERRRIARDIHDTTVQQLALLAMNLSQLKGATAGERAARMVAQSAELTTQCVQELRTLTYVLHPPMLDELGLASALRIYVEGIEQRSGLRITTEAEQDLPRFDPETEMALFRVAQESLGNVLRHSGSETAHIHLYRDNGIVMKISDEGKGIPADRRPTERPANVGVGIAGMNERIRQLGGKLTIDSGPKGTTVTAYIPEKGAHVAKLA